MISRQRTFRIIYSILMVFLFVFLSGCSQKQEEQPKLRLGFFPNVTHAPALVGIDQGFFQSELGQIKLETRVFSAGPELMEAMAAGEIDVAYIGPGPALTGFARGVPIQIISGASSAGAVLVADPKSNINGLKDLAGKKVAIPQYGNTQDISLRHLLVEYGLKDKAKGGDVEIFQAAPADVLSLFSQNQVDAALIPEPWGAILEQKGGAKLVLDWNHIWKEGNYPTTVVITRKDYAEKNPSIINAFLAAHRKAVEFINCRPDERGKIVNNQLKIITNKEIPAEVLETAFRRTHATIDIDWQVLQEYADILVEAGYLKERVDISRMKQAF
ncbi:Putative aliphatic sulfonates-binding protein [Sporomusa silvacetica DSM 10669]|uniref:Aliphatic sulfonates-binding protein n=1 Tax=Sporomusa silvacetica DSM 10669 TaxID=1123289 RepID=A0ABZ3IM84_9FIRM|nr:aliphatic sulfonate ABC transporter substrate-binding protein [Sporomusa silvacetica]OZC22980.1 putative aliphatic sulfonates-binding protein precursor [Sporomusa silvacetica DSM 10669]